MKINFQIIVPILWIIIFYGCSLIGEEDSPKLYEIDFLYGTEESGKLKKQLNFSDSNDETVNTDIDFIYNNNRLLGKIYNDHFGSQSYILQMDEFYYDGVRLSKMIHYFRTGTISDPLLISKIYYYSYPDNNTKIEVIYNDEGERRDSVIYKFSGSLLTEEKHINHLGIWGSKYEYNNDGKQYKIIDLVDEGKITVNYFDDDGLLYKTEGLNDGVVVSVSTYESEITHSSLIIKEYSENIYMNGERWLSAQKTYKKGKLVEYIKYHPTFPGSEWYCTRFEYF